MYRKYINKQVVVDAEGPFVYIGRMRKVSSDFLELEEVDVHDINDSSSTKEIYLRQALETGIRPNRENCRIARARVISISLYKDIL